MATLKILFVDDNEQVLNDYKAHCASLTTESTTLLSEIADTHRMAKEKLKNAKSKSGKEIDIVFIDFHFGDGKPDGIALAEELKKLYPNLLMVLVTGYYNQDPPLAKAIRSSCFVDILDRGQFAVNGLSNFLAHNSSLRLKLQAITLGDNIKKFTEKELLSTLVRMYCVEKTISTQKGFATGVFKLDEKENVEQKRVEAGISYIQTKLNFNISNLGGRSKQTVSEFVEGGTFDNLQALVLDSSDYVAINNIEKNMTKEQKSNRRDKMFFSDNKLKVRQILLEQQEQFLLTCEHYKPVKDIKIEFGI